MGSLSLALSQKESLSLRKERVTQVALSCVMREVDEKPMGSLSLALSQKFHNFTISQFHDFTISQFHNFRLPPAEQKKVTQIPL